MKMPLKMDELHWKSGEKRFKVAVSGEEFTAVNDEPILKSMT